jgi:hypothetical protein
MTTESTATVPTTARPGKLRRAWEWAWRSESGRELQEKRAVATDDQAIVVAKGCQRLAWRTLGGLEPIPAAIRADVARPLVVAGLTRCLPLLSPPLSGVAELFEEPLWRERLIAGGVPEKDLEAASRWLLGDAHDPSASTAQLGLQVLNAVVDHLDHEGGAIRRLRWRRTGVIAAMVAVLLAITLAVVLLVIPDPGPDIGVGKTWRASSAYPGYVASGTKQASPKEGAFFCTNEDVEPWWTIDLRRATSIGSLTVLNRGDCCIERAPPLVVELSTDGKKWKEVARTTEAFRTWRPSFEPTKARHVRLRSLRRTFLHLQDVRIHAAD